MHIPDGFLKPDVLIATNGISLIGVAAAIYYVNRKITPERVPLMGISATFIFVAQLALFPLGPTSAHINGSVLISILLGPFTGLVITTSALIIHALLQHGGWLTLGANVLNIGVIGCLAGYLIYYVLPKRYFISAGLAAWLAIVLSSLACGLELGFSGKIPIPEGIWALVIIHMLVGLVEASVTVMILSVVNKIRPDLLKLPKI